MAKPILGKKESQSLEFKARDALKNPSIIGREVVGMLNSEEGGEILVGVGEEKGISKSIEPIEEAQQAARELKDHLIDTLEPPLTESEVNVEAVKVGSLGSILRIKVRPNEKRRPYAQITKGGRHFTVRTSDRVRPMSREEIAELFAGSMKGKKREEDRIAEGANQLQEERYRHWRFGDETIWFRIKPVQKLKINVRDEEIKRLLRDPRLSNNRPNGWNFTSRMVEPRHDQDSIFLKRGARSEVRIRENGGMKMVEELGRLQWKGNEKEIYPWVLLELPTSFVRLASVLYQPWLEDMSETKVLADFALFSIRGWILRPGSPESPRYELYEAKPQEEKNNFVLPAPMVFTLGEVVNEPDRCAYRIIRKVYFDFGLDEEDIPDAYDRRTGKLAILR